MAFRGIEDSVVMQHLLPSCQTQTSHRAVLVLRVTAVLGISITARSCHCRGCAAAARGARRLRAKIDPSKVEAPYVTYLSKEEDPGETGDGDGFIREG